MESLIDGLDPSSYFMLIINIDNNVNKNNTVSKPQDARLTSKTLESLLS